MKRLLAVMKLFVAISSFVIIAAFGIVAFGEELGESSHTLPVLFIASITWLVAIALRDAIMSLPAIDCVDGKGHEWFDVRYGVRMCKKCRTVEYLTVDVSTGNSRWVAVHQED